MSNERRPVRSNDRPQRRDMQEGVRKPVPMPQTQQRRRKKVKFTKKERIKFVSSVCMIIVSFIAVATTLLLNWSPLSGGIDIGKDGDQQGAISGRTHNDNVTYFLCAGFDESEFLTDVLMVVAVFKKEQTIKILTIPRDTYIGSEIITGKINAVYGHAKSPYPEKYDIRNLASYINTNIGLPIDYYVTINLKGLRSVVDAVGGIPIYIENNMYDSAGDWLVFKKGYHVLDGEDAENFVRFRHGYKTGDLGRQDAQKVFLAAFLEKMQGLSKSKMLSLVTGQLAKYVKTDLTVSEMMTYAEAIWGVDMANIENFTVPGKTFKSKYEGSYGLSCYAIDKNALITLLNSEFVSEGYTIDPESVSPIEVEGVSFPTSSEVEVPTTFDDYLTSSTSSKKTSSTSSSKSSG